MAELADALDSGSSEHYAHASSSLVIRITKIAVSYTHLTIAAAADWLIAVFDVTLNHETFYKSSDIFGKMAAMHYFFCNTNLLKVMFTGVCMVCVNNYTWIL